MKINSKEYWESRFGTGDWERKNGRDQTIRYAKANARHMKKVLGNYEGSLLDFGCGLGDSTPVYRKLFPKVKLFGLDISSEAVKKANAQYGNDCYFYAGTEVNVKDSDVIICSNVMEHIVNDKVMVKSLLSKCKFLFISVPYKEVLLFDEHVNSYDENYYSDFEVIYAKPFSLGFSWTLYDFKIFVNLTIGNLVRQLLGKKKAIDPKQIIFCIKGEISQK